MDEIKQLEEDSVPEANRRLTKREIHEFIEVLANLKPMDDTLVSYKKDQMIQKLLWLL